MACCSKCRGACTCSRSEEHTSELQSQSNLVCRLLLEKKEHTAILEPHSAPACPLPTLTHRPGCSTPEPFDSRHRHCSYDRFTSRESLSLTRRERHTAT